MGANVVSAVAEARDEAVGLAAHDGRGGSGDGGSGAAELGAGGSGRGGASLGDPRCSLASAVTHAAPEMHKALSQSNGRMGREPHSSRRRRITLFHRIG
ncbi:Hypothetical protein A7982_05585 [Minicystis rosea]|nr:Hypothetical protein A7982_05585 [Minicystis rosea]